MIALLVILDSIHHHNIVYQPSVYNSYYSLGVNPVSFAAAVNSYRAGR